MNPPTYVAGASLSDLTIYWTDSRHGELHDFSTGWTFSLVVSLKGSGVAAFTKTTGIVGQAVGPNVIISWPSSGELAGLAAGDYVIQLTATRTSDGKKRRVRGQLLVHPAAV